MCILLLIIKIIIQFTTKMYVSKYLKINVYINLVLGVNHHTRLPVFPTITIKMLLEI